MKIFYWKYLLAFLLVNSILSIPLKSNERDKNDIVNLRVKRQGISIKMFSYINISSLNRQGNVTV
jgi:hypothetical protein